jgi:inhibitor of cysteine peptidase
MKKLTATFNEIAVKKGDYFLIELEGNPSTGYLWQFNVTAGKASAVHNDMVPFDRNPMVIGGGGMERTVMQAEEAGTIEIEAQLVRPWDKTSVARQHRFKITVE